MKNFPIILASLLFATNAIAAPSNYQAEHGVFEIDVNRLTKDGTDHFVALVDCIENGFESGLSGTGHEAMLDKYESEFEDTRTHFRQCDDIDDEIELMVCIFEGVTRLQNTSKEFITEVYAVDEDLAHQLAEDKEECIDDDKTPIGPFIKHAMDKFVADFH